MEKYGEILFLGKCNCKCFYCLSNEMSKLKSDEENQMNVHYSNWKNFNKFLDMLKQNNIRKIYLSSVTTEPMMYKYLKELIQSLIDNSFTVGIRTNGYFALDKKDVFHLLNEEISISINSLNQNTNELISNTKTIPDYNKIFKYFESIGTKCRVSIVVNQYNMYEIMNIIHELKKYTCVSYIQLRKVYKYYECDNTKNEDSFEYVCKEIARTYKQIDQYYESPIYDIEGVSVSLWETVFKKESIESLNYFTNGIISDNTLLIPAYEDKGI